MSSTNSNFFQNRSPLKFENDILVTPTYNLAEYGRDLFIPLTSTIADSTFTNKAANILRNTFTGAAAATTGEGKDHYPTVIANTEPLVF